MGLEWILLRNKFLNIILCCFLTSCGNSWNFSVRSLLKGRQAIRSVANVLWVAIATRFVKHHCCDRRSYPQKLLKVRKEAGTSVKDWFHLTHLKSSFYDRKRLSTCPCGIIAKCLSHWLFGNSRHDFISLLHASEYWKMIKFIWFKWSKLFKFFFLKDSGRRPEIRQSFLTFLTTINTICNSISLTVFFKVLHTTNA